MRAVTCLACAHSGWVTGLQHLAVAVAEQLHGERTHHHHVMSCTSCGGRWFDDATAGPGGVPIPARRDTLLCPCPDGLQQYVPSLVFVPAPERDCHCGSSVLARARAS